MSYPQPFPRDVQEALDEMKAGRPIIVIDRWDRENEGDLVLAASRATRENLALIMRQARGLMCLPTAGEILDRLEIPMMVQHSDRPSRHALHGFY